MHHMKFKSSSRFKFNNSLKAILLFCAVCFSIQAFQIFTSQKDKIKDNEIETYLLHQIQSSRIVDPRYPLVKEFSPKVSFKKFNNEEARKIGFNIKFYPNRTIYNSIQKVIYLATKYFNEFNPKHYYFLHMGNITFRRYQCPIYKCYVTKEPSALKSADAVLFHVRDIEISEIPNIRSQNQIWIIYSMEPPWLEIKDMRRFEGIFNWTMSYRRNSDILMSYGFIGTKPKAISVNATNKERMKLLLTKQSKAVWFVSNCQTDSNREEYVRRLMKVFPVDVVGGCGLEACRPAETKKCYVKMAKHYKFYLAFENAICQDYVTEKLFNSLAYNIVPITFGGANYSAITPAKSVVNAMDFRTPEDLGKRLWEISRNNTEYLSYFDWKSKYRSYLQPWMCDLCAKLHEPIKHQIKYNLDEWWQEEHSCMKWSSDNFTLVKDHPFPKFNTKIFA